MQAETEGRQLPPDAAEMKALVSRLRWGFQTASEVLGRNRKTVLRWLQGKKPVGKPDLEFVRAVAAFLDAAPALAATPPGPLSGLAMRAIVERLGWSVVRRHEPLFSELAGLDQERVWRMAAGIDPVPSGLGDALLDLNERLDEPPVLSEKTLQAQAQAGEGDGAHAG